MVVSESAGADVTGQAMASSHTGHLQTVAAQTLPAVPPTFEARGLFTPCAAEKGWGSKGFDSWKFTLDIK